MADAAWKMAPWLETIVGKGLPPPTADMDPAADEERDRRERAREHATALERSIPAEWRWARLDSPLLTERITPAQPMATLEHAVSSARVVLLGPSGSGKTSVGVAILRERAKALQAPARFFLAHRLGLARAQHRLGDGEAALVEEAIRLPLVLLDSVGQDDSPRGIEACRDVISERFAEQRSTIVTLDLTVQQTQAKFGDGFARRLFERATVIKLGVAK